MSTAYFVTGTDTDVGKTLVSAALLRGFAGRGLRVVGMKPVASGAIRQTGEMVWADVLQLQAESNVDAPLAVRNPYRFVPPIAPHIAARQVGERVDMAVIQRAYNQLRDAADRVIVEGAGGFYAPLNDADTMADLASQLALPVILVVALRLGCINHALLTAEAVAARGLTLAGWVANQSQPPMSAMAENLAYLERHIAAPLLGVVPHQAHPAPEAALPYLNLEGLC